MRVFRRRAVPLLISLCAAFAASAAAAQSAREFYQNKNLTFIVGSSAGGSYDLTARAVGRHLPNHLPGVGTVIVRDMPGAGGLLSVLYLDNTGPKDGTVLSAFNAGVISDSIAAGAQAKTKFTDYAWIGSVMRDLRVCYAWGGANISSWADMAKRKETVFGATGVNSNSYNGAATIRNMFGINIKIIAAYPGTSEMFVAIERGELDAACSSWVALPPAWVKDKKINVLVRLGTGTTAEIPASVPFIGDLASSQEQKDIIDILKAPADLGRPFIVSKEVPEDRVALLREAFNATMNDPAFKADAEKQGLWVDPINGADAQAMIDRLYGFSPELISKMQAVLK